MSNTPLRWATACEVEPDSAMLATEISSGTTTLGTIVLITSLYCCAGRQGATPE